jgi:hypothetical protein
VDVGETGSWCFLEGVRASQSVGADYIIAKIIDNKKTLWFFPFGFPR